METNQSSKFEILDIYRKFLSLYIEINSGTEYLQSKGILYVANLRKLSVKIILASISIECCTYVEDAKKIVIWLWGKENFQIELWLLKGPVNSKGNFPKK